MSDRYRIIVISNIQHSSYASDLGRLASSLESSLNRGADDGYVIKQVVPSGDGSLIIMEREEYLELLDAKASKDALHEIV